MTPAELRERSRLTDQGCIEWTGARTSAGYGNVIPKGTRRNAMVHRLAWELERGPIPAGLWVLHHCDNPPCFNVDHLFLGTAQDNSADMVRKGRACFGDRNGSRRHPERMPRGDNHRARYDGSYLSRGEQNPMARLTVETVIAMRRERAEAGTPYRLLAEKYGVAQMTAWRAVTGRLWASVK